MIGWHHASDRQRKQACVQPSAPKMFGERLDLFIPGFLEDSIFYVGSRSLPNLSISREVESFCHTRATVQGNLA